MKSGIEFDEAGLLARIAKAGRDVLKRAGAYVRTVARRRILTSPKPSQPGQPPHSRRGLLKRAILFGLDREGKSVLVGPGFNGALSEAPPYGTVAQGLRPAAGEDVERSGQMTVSNTKQNKEK